MCKFVVCANEVLENLREIKKGINKQTLVCAVVKADAYGFGMSKMVSLLKGEVDYFAVARLSEFLKFKELGTDKPCLILSPLSRKELNVAIKEGAEISLTQESELKEIEKVCEKHNTRAKVHIKLDTGMNRFGIKDKEELIRVLKKIKDSSNINLVGCYSHLFFAENLQISEAQNTIFNEFRQLVLSFGFKPIFHLANSKGLKNKSCIYDMVRAGLGLYFKGKDSEHKFICEVVQVKSVKKGESVSYNGKFKAKRDMVIAIVNAGYGDGINRLISNKGKVLIHGKECKILGNICMDAFMVDVTALRAVQNGDEVVIFGKVNENVISVCELAKMCDTIPYEIFTSISQRVKRVYRWRRYEYYHRKIQGQSSLYSRQL